MRLTLAASIFALAVLAAACGGGGKSGVLPSSPNQPSGLSTPSSSKSHMLVTLLIPPAAKQANDARKPFFLSPSTESIVFAVVAEGQTPTPAEEQVFPIATPTPCSINATIGVESCTFTVQAPFGTDIFYLATFGVTAPTASSIPLASFTSAPIVIASPGAGGSTPAPITFVVNGVVASVKLTVSTPDPGTSNTQTFTAGVATTAQPLGITPYDSSGNPILAQTFDSPITINVASNATIANMGVGLTFTPTCSTSRTGIVRKTRRRNAAPTYATVQIGCAADLGAVGYAYDGTVTPDATTHITDSYTISTAQLVSPAPSPATILLASNVQTTLITPGTAGAQYYGTLLLLANGTFLYAYQYNQQTWVGTFDPVAQTATTPVALTGIPGDLISANAVTVAPNGSLWVASNGSESASNLYCYTTVADALGGQAPALTGVNPSIPASVPDTMQVAGITTDSAGNLWYVGWDNGPNNPTGPAPSVYAGYVATTATSGCAAPSPTAPFNLSGAYNDQGMGIAPLPGGGVAVQNSANTSYSANTIYTIRTGSPSVVSPVSPILASANGAGIAVDALGNIYGAYWNYSGAADIESMQQAATALNTLTALPPFISGGVPAPLPAAIAAFSPTTGAAADRLAYIDNDYAALGLVEGVPASPMPLLQNLPNARGPIATAYATDGTAYALFYDFAGSVQISHILSTRIWNVAVPQVPNFCSENTGVISILERTDSGPFTVSADTGVTATALSGVDHDYWLTGLPASGTFNLSVTDAHSRSETIPVTTNAVSGACP